MFRPLLLGCAAILIAAPALAAESCDQPLKDTQAAFKTSTIGPKETARADAAIKQAEDLCKQGKAAEANDLLRLARTMIGE
jgi:hypothetical protein